MDCHPRDVRPYGPGLAITLAVTILARNCLSSIGENKAMDNRLNFVSFARWTSGRSGVASGHDVEPTIDCSAPAQIAKRVAV